MKRFHFKRFYFHPIITNKTSRSIFILYLLLTYSVGLYAWGRFERVCSNMELIALMYDNTYLNLLLSPYFKYLILLVVALVAAGLTAFQVVGPISRIETWLTAWYSGFKVGTLQNRTTDEFNTLIKLLNEFHRKME